MQVLAASGRIVRSIAMLRRHSWRRRAALCNRVALLPQSCSCWMAATGCFWHCRCMVYRHADGSGMAESGRIARSRPPAAAALLTVPLQELPLLDGCHRVLWALCQLMSAPLHEFQSALV